VSNESSPYLGGQDLVSALGEAPTDRSEITSDSTFSPLPTVRFGHANPKYPSDHNSMSDRVKAHQIKDESDTAQSVQLENELHASATEVRSPSARKTFVG